MTHGKKSCLPDHYVNPNGRSTDNLTSEDLKIYETLHEKLIKLDEVNSD